MNGFATRLIVSLSVLALTVGAAACGGGDDTATEVEPAKVSTDLVPATLGADLVLKEDEKAKKSYANLAENALVADGALYAVRQGERLVATLQLSTLLPEVDLTDPERVDEMADKLLPGVKQELRVADVSVFEVPGEDKVVYLWFGRQMFQVLQVKSTKVDPEEILKQLIAFQRQSPAWEPLPEVEEEF